MAATSTGGQERTPHASPYLSRELGASHAAAVVVGTIVGGGFFSSPAAARPYQMWGYPFTPAIFVAVAAALLCYTFWNERPNSWYGLLVILAGIPVFAYFAWRRRLAKQIRES